MSAPLVVNTRDGACWTRRTVTEGGIALYALADVCQCPEFVMATLPELAERGIVGSADGLPMPVGPALVSEAELDGAMGELAAFLRVRLALESARRGRRELRAQVTDLEAVRDQLVRWHGEDAKTITTLVARVDRYRAELTALRNDALSMRGSLAQADGDRKVPFELGETLTPAVDWLIARVAELEAAPTAVYRAEHPDSGITLGHYSTAKAARDHCEDLERRSWPTGTTLAFDWIEDDEDRVAELVVVAGQNEESTTGYVVTALEAPSEYDAEADE
ncbi:hypothetical protein ACIPH4_10810 [Streptomyces tendae]|uniref:hypothetical protein n=1 Tax=Streptomyces tendae TaxID=1932 RepID=UPI003828EC16